MGPVRKATPDDAWACADVHVASWKAGYRGILPDEYLDGLRTEDRLPWWTQTLELSEGDGPLDLMVIEDDAGEVCGFGSTTRPDRGHSAHVAQLYLAPSAWGTGAADTLMRVLLDNLAHQGVDSVSLRVARDNARACRFYERSGWTRVEGSEATEEIWGVEVLTVEYQRHLGPR